MNHTWKHRTALATAPFCAAAGLVLAATPAHAVGPHYTCAIVTSGIEDNQLVVTGLSCVGDAPSAYVGPLTITEGRTGVRYQCGDQSFAARVGPLDTLEVTGIDCDRSGPGQPRS